MVLPSMQHQNISQVGLTVIAEYLVTKRDGMKHDRHIYKGWPNGEAEGLINSEQRVFNWSLIF